MAWAAVIGASAGLLGASMSSRAASRAADAQTQAADAAIAEQQRQYDTTREDFAPYRAAGTNALQQLVGQMGQQVTPQEVMQDPGYRFGMDQGLQALARRQAAMGGRVSGQALRAASRFGTDYGASGYNAAYQRRQDALNRLAAIAGIGQTATGSSAVAGGQASNAISNMLMQAGDNQGTARLAQGNIWGNAFGDIGAQYMRRNPGGSTAPFFGPTWQQRGGAMDTNDYGGFGPNGGP